MHKDECVTSHFMYTCVNMSIFHFLAIYLFLCVDISNFRQLVHIFDFKRCSHYFTLSCLVSNLSLVTLNTWKGHGHVRFMVMCAGLALEDKILGNWNMWVSARLCSSVVMLYDTIPLFRSCKWSTGVEYWSTKLYSWWCVSSNMVCHTFTHIHSLIHMYTHTNPNTHTVSGQ